MRAAEMARFEQAAHLNNGLLSPTLDPKVEQHPARVQPNTPTEDEALARIDELREEERERLGDTFAARRRRAARYWRTRI